MATKDKKKTEAKEKKPIASKENEALDSSKSMDSLESSEERLIALSDAVSKTSQLSNRLVIISSGILTLLLLGIGVFTFLLSSRIGELDESTRAAMARVEEIGLTIEALTTAQNDFGIKQAEVSVAIEKSGTSVAEMQNNLPEATAQSLSIETDKMGAQILALKEEIGHVHEHITGVSDVATLINTQLAEVGTQLAAVKDLNDDVTALVTLEKAKYLSVLERQAELQEKQTGPMAVKVPRDPNLIFYSIQSSQE